MIKWKALLAAAAVTVAPLALSGAASAQNAPYGNGYGGYDYQAPTQAQVQQNDAYAAENQGYDSEDGDGSGYGYGAPSDQTAQAPMPPAQPAPPANGYAYSPYGCSQDYPYTASNPYCAPADYGDAYVDYWGYPDYYGYGYGYPGYYGYGYGYGGYYGHDRYGHDHQWNGQSASYGQHNNYGQHYSAPAGGVASGVGTGHAFQGGAASFNRAGVSHFSGATMGVSRGGGGGIGNRR